MVLKTQFYYSTVNRYAFFERVGVAKWQDPRAGFFQTCYFVSVNDPAGRLAKHFFSFISITSKSIRDLGNVCSSAANNENLSKVSCFGQQKQRSWHYFNLFWQMPKKIKHDTTIVAANICISGVTRFVMDIKSVDYIFFIQYINITLMDFVILVSSWLTLTNAYKKRVSFWTRILNGSWIRSIYLFASQFH